MSTQPTGTLASVLERFRAFTQTQQDQSPADDVRRSGQALDETMREYVAATEKRHQVVSGNRHETDMARTRALVTRLQQTDLREVQACQTLEAEMVERLNALHCHFQEDNELVRLTVQGPNQISQIRAFTYVRRSDPLQHVMTHFLQQYYRQTIASTVFQFFAPGSTPDTHRLVKPSDTLRDLQLTSPHVTIRMSFHARSLTISRPAPDTQNLPRGGRYLGHFKIAVQFPSAPAPTQAALLQATPPQAAAAVPAPRQAVLPQAASAGAGSAPTAQPFGGAALPEVSLLSQRAGRLQTGRDIMLIRGMQDIDRGDSRVPQDPIQIGDYVDVLTAIAQMCQRDEFTFEAPHPLRPDQVLRLPRVQVLVYLGITFACQPCKSEEEVTIEIWRLRQYVLGFDALMRELPGLLRWYKAARGRDGLHSAKRWPEWLPMDSVKAVFGHDELRRYDAQTFKLFNINSWEDLSIPDPVKADTARTAAPGRVDLLGQAMSWLCAMSMGRCSMCLQPTTVRALSQLDHLVPAEMKWSQGSPERYRKKMDPKDAFRRLYNKSQELWDKGYQDLCMTRMACANCNTAAARAATEHCNSLGAGV